MFSNTHRRTRGFTLIELLVVISMIAVLAGALSSAVNTSIRQSKVAKATAETSEITNAILAYENYARDYSLAAHVASDVEASESTLGFLLGKENVAQAGATGNIPVLYNAAVSSDGKIRDPWGTTYKVTIKEATGTITDPVAGGTISTAVFFPNFYRINP